LLSSCARDQRGRAPDDIQHDLLVETYRLELDPELTQEFAFSIAAFRALSGLSKDRALQELNSSNGISCVESICRFTTRVQVGELARQRNHDNPDIFAGAITTHYEIDIRSEFIEDPSNIITTVTTTRVEE
jgi:hypothetical protein